MKVKDILKRHKRARVYLYYPRDIYVYKENEKVKETLLDDEIEKYMYCEFPRYNCLMIWVGKCTIDPLSK